MKLKHHIVTLVGKANKTHKRHTHTYRVLEFVGGSLSGLEMGACSLEAATTTKQ
jgi:hypothetical protein